MKTSITKIKKQSKEIGMMVHRARKKLFELEIMQSMWESDHGLGKVYNSAEELIATINKKTTVYL